MSSGWADNFCSTVLHATFKMRDFRHLLILISDWREAEGEEGGWFERDPHSWLNKLFLTKYMHHFGSETVNTCLKYRSITDIIYINFPVPVKAGKRILMWGSSEVPGPYRTPLEPQLSLTQNSMRLSFCSSASPRHGKVDLNSRSCLLCPLVEQTTFVRRFYMQL